MSPTLKKLGIDRLSLAERILLVEEIWDSIAAEGKVPPLTQEQKRELDRRIAAADANPEAESPGKEVKATLSGQAMSLAFVIRPEAESDLAGAKDWYDQHRPGLGDEFLLCVEEAFERIRRFPYLVCYRIKKTAIEVLAVPRGSQDWSKWKRRV